MSSGDPGNTEALLCCVNSHSGVVYSNIAIKIETVSDTEVSGTGDHPSAFVSVKKELITNSRVTNAKREPSARTNTILKKKQLFSSDNKIGNSKTKKSRTSSLNTNDPMYSDTNCKDTSSKADFDNSVEYTTQSSSSMKLGRAELKQHLHNLETILLNSNATPVKSHNGKGYLCCFCALYYPDPQELKNHTIEKHSDLTQKERYTCFSKHKTMREFCVMLDITNLLCYICRKEIIAFDQLLMHLNKDHEKKMFTDLNNHILPFKFNSGVCECVLCLKRYESFNLMRQHMNIHYNNFVCELCGASFVTQRQYSNHIVQRHSTSDGAKVQCSLCSKVFDTEHKKRCHEKSVHIHAHKRSKCALCGEKLRCDSKLKHMETVHGVETPLLKCNACERTFKTKIALRTHTRRDHLMERPHKCGLCDKSFYQSHLLDNHMLKHTGKKEFQCEICLKSYGRKFTLQQHMRIHMNDRKFKCERCGMAFVHKCSWKSHMRSTHGETLQ